MGQTDSVKIQGRILYPTQKYACLLLSNEDSLIVSPIVNQKFAFTTVLEALNPNRKDSILRSTNKRLIALESAEISIRNDTHDAGITGGKYNSQINEMMNAIKEGRYAYFFSTYPDSPVSILFLKSLLILKQNKIMGLDIDLKQFVDLLSVTVKRSAEGRILMEKISQLK
jgi:hypothetical protein